MSRARVLWSDREGGLVSNLVPSCLLPSYQLLCIYKLALAAEILTRKQADRYCVHLHQPSSRVKARSIKSRLVEGFSGSQLQC